MRSDSNRRIYRAAVSARRLSSTAPHMPPMTSIAAMMSIARPVELTRTSRGVDRSNTDGSSELSSALLFSIGALLLRAVRSTQTTGILQCTTQQIFDLPVDAAELGRRPSLQRVVDLGIQPKGKSLFVGHFLVCRGARGLQRGSRVGVPYPPARPVSRDLRPLDNVCEIDRLQCAHWYNVPVFTTGSTPFSLHSTTRRLLTIAAFRSSSSATTFLRL